MILSAQTIRQRLVFLSERALGIDPFSERTVVRGMSYGLSSAGYDLRIADDLILDPGAFTLATSMEWFSLPADVMGALADKSSWARRGVALQNTIFEPGWRGYPTLELSNHSSRVVEIRSGDPIGQMIFHLLDEPTEQPYSGKYQDQPQRPIRALDEEEVQCR